VKVLLTGGTGFLGRRLVEALRPRHALRLLVRRPQARRDLPGEVEVAPGDVADAAALERAAAGCEAVVHAAALVKILAPESEFERTNVGGLENLVAAARAAGARKVVYVSSFIALGPTEGGPGGTLDEGAEPRDRPWINAYERTKALADRRARGAIAAGEPWNVVYPGVIYGPGELTEGNIVVRHLLDLAHRRVPALLGRPERRWNYVFVDDVARGIVAVLERAPAGERYVLGGENVTQEDFYRLAAELGAIDVPSRRMPDGLAKAAGALARGWARLSGTVPKLTPDLVEIYRHDWAYDSWRARRELGYEARSLRAGLTSTFAWLRQIGEMP
jgi:nucleoside-diphosphate-sugar epimerase